MARVSFHEWPESARMIWGEQEVSTPSGPPSSRPDSTVQCQETILSTLTRSKMSPDLSRVVMVIRSRTLSMQPSPRPPTQSVAPPCAPSDSRTSARHSRVSSRSRDPPVRTGSPWNITKCPRPGQVSIHRATRLDIVTILHRTFYSELFKL